MKEMIDMMSDFDIRYRITDYKEREFKKGVASKKFIRDFNVTSVKDIERVHRIVDVVYSE